MLEYAKKYEPELKNLFNDIAFDLYYQFAFTRAYRDTLEIPNDTNWGNRFVSRHENKILGYLEYDINRASNIVSSLQLIRLSSENIFVFTKDILTAINDIFEKYQFRKLDFCVVVGNPIESVYDRLVSEMGGRIVGTWKQDVKLLDGNIYDEKAYELFADDYFKSRYYQRFKKNQNAVNG